MWVQIQISPEFGLEMFIFGVLVVHVVETDLCCVAGVVGAGVGSHSVP